MSLFLPLSVEIGNREKIDFRTKLHSFFLSSFEVHETAPGEVPSDAQIKAGGCHDTAAMMVHNGE